MKSTDKVSLGEVERFHLLLAEVPIQNIDNLRLRSKLVMPILLTKTEADQLFRSNISGRRPRQVDPLSIRTEEQVRLIGRCPENSFAIRDGERQEQVPHHGQHLGHRGPRRHRFLSHSRRQGKTITVY